MACLQPAQTASPKPARPVTKKPSPEHDSHLALPASPKYVRPANKKSLPVADSLPSAGAPGEGPDAAAASAASNSNSRVCNPATAQTLLHELPINCTPTKLALALHSPSSHAVLAATNVIAWRRFYAVTNIVHRHSERQACDSLGVPDCLFERGTLMRGFNVLSCPNSSSGNSKCEA